MNNLLKASESGTLFAGVPTRTSRANSGVSEIANRRYRPAPTRTMLRRNGTRQPQFRSASCVIVAVTTR